MDRGREEERERWQRGRGGREGRGEGRRRKQLEGGVEERQRGRKGALTGSAEGVLASAPPRP